MRQQIEAQHTSWGQGCSSTFVVNSLPLWSNPAPHVLDSHILSTLAYVISKSIFAN